MKTGKIYVTLLALAVSGIIAVLALVHDANETRAETKDEIKTPQESVVASDEDSASKSGLDLETILGDRAYGDPNAPVRIDEYASLSCSHCAMFHKNTFPEIKKEFIDTGKVYFVFHDFPLNAQALSAAIIARCLPEERYFKFLSFLFDKQDTWAFEQNFLTILKQSAKLAGGSGETIDACLENKDIQEALVTKMQDASKAHEINSTPSFVLNGVKFSGSQSFKTFKKKIEAELSKAR